MKVDGNYIQQASFYNNHINGNRQETYLYCNWLSKINLFTNFDPVAKAIHGCY